MTIEIEHVDAITLEKLEQQGIDCQPKASTIRIIQVTSFIHIYVPIYTNSLFVSFSSSCFFFVEKTKDQHNTF